MENNKLMMYACIIGILVAIGIVFSGICKVSEANDFAKNAVELQATVSQVNQRLKSGTGSNGRVYDTYVDYEYNGTVYRKAKLKSRSIEAKIGDKVKILVDPTNPVVITESQSGKAFGYAKIVFGIVMALVMLSKMQELKNN